MTVSKMATALAEMHGIPDTKATKIVQRLASYYQTVFRISGKVNIKGFATIKTLHRPIRGRLPAYTQSGDYVSTPYLGMKFLVKVRASKKMIKKIKAHP